MCNDIIGIGIIIEYDERRPGLPNAPAVVVVVLENDNNRIEIQPSKHTT